MLNWHTYKKQSARAFDLAWEWSKQALRWFWKWSKREFTGMRGKSKLVVTAKILWWTIKIIGITLLILIMILKFLLSIGNSDD